MIFLLPNRTHAKANWRQRWPINRTGLSHLQEKLLGRLLVGRTLKHHDSIRTVPGSHSTPAEPEIRHWELLRGGPAIVLHQFSCPAFATKLNLRRHQQNRVLAGINDREQDRNLIAAIEDLADSNPQPVAFHVFCFDPLSIQYGEWSRLLPAQEIIQRGRRWR
jgi:hypothetical protein